MPMVYGNSVNSVHTLRTFAPASNDPAVKKGSSGPKVTAETVKEVIIKAKGDLHKKGGGGGMTMTNILFVWL